MKERPILFSAPLVRAILDGRKTVTRRPVKSPHVGDLDAFAYDAARGLWEGGVYGDGGAVAHGEWVRCPYGQAGDRLWVRESSWLLGISDSEPRVVGPDAPGEPGDPPRVWYAADGERPPLPQYPPWCWLRRNSIHMPRWASRITLEVTSVGVERLQDITEDGVFADGVPVPVTTDGCPRGKAAVLHTLSGRFPSIQYARPGASTSDIVRAHFASAWDSIYGAGSWASSPWVWVVRFRRER